MTLRTKAPAPAKSGTKPRHEALGLTLDDVRGMYRVMLQCRMLGERMMQLNRMGRAAFVGVADGHEGAEVGSAWCIQRGVDWCHPYYRDVGVALVLGQTAKDQFLGVFAKATDPNSAGRQIVNQFSDVEAKIVTGSVNIATQFPQAAGIALALKMRKEKAVVFTYGGDGSTSPGDFHEALNFAAVYAAPTVFLVQNNGYAISVPLSNQSRAPTMAHKAVGYGMPGVRVDGNDAAAVYAATAAAVERAADGDGPTLIEAVTYRTEAHTTADDDSRYRSAEEVDEWRGRDPIARLEAYLSAVGLLDEAAIEAVGDEAAAVARSFRAGMFDAPHGDPLEMFTHVYVDPPAGLLAQRDALAAELASRGDHRR